MSAALVSQVATQLGALMDQEFRLEVRLVEGVDKEIQKILFTLEFIECFLVDLDKRQVKYEAVKNWMEMLEDICYDTDYVLAKWSMGILKQQIEGLDEKQVDCFVSLLLFGFNQVAYGRDIALKIKNISERLDVLGIEKDRYNFNMIIPRKECKRPKSNSFIDVSKVCGRYDDMDTLLSKLFTESSKVDSCLHIIAVVGMGGIGKTTLAQLVYKCNKVINHFEIRIWVDASEPFDQLLVAKEIIEHIEGNPLNSNQPETVLGRVRKCIEGKKFLLVLDDVWTEDDEIWRPLLNYLMTCATGSIILVTTRNERVALIMRATYTLHLGLLSDQDCWSLFNQIAFSERSMKNDEKLEDVGRKIAYKCKGLPLAAKSMGSLMHLKNTINAWQDVLDSEIWELEEAKRGIFPTLLLSYNNLPSAVKRCFLYCASFPKDYKIETDNLIKLWMAHGYLNSRTGEAMELLGREYLENLVGLSFFQDLEKDKDCGNVTRFKMHDIVHDFAHSLKKNECLIVEADKGVVGRVGLTCETPRHLTVIRAKGAPYPVLFDNTKKLQTLWVQRSNDSPALVSPIDSVPSDFFVHLKYLKALDLSHNKLLALPNGVGKLLNLRYLNLSHNPLFNLPETVCELGNLQTLKLVGCDHLSRLPQGMWKLINLRHLEIDDTDDMKTLPKAIGRLRCLRTLSKFVICNDGHTEEAICKIRDLEKLNLLGGCLKIKGLGYVVDASEAEKAELKNKKHLSHLHMDFSPLVQAKGTTEVAEALQLHSYLQYLNIMHYGGTRFPNWIMSLTGLKHLRLQECQYCTCLPPLGKLPCLETLYITSMRNLKSVGHEFLGVEVDSLTGGSSSVIFPHLKKLKFSSMESWEKWDVISTGSVEEDSICIMPRLSCLKLFNCHNLETLPHSLLQMTPLKTLSIHNCLLLQLRYQEGIGEEWIQISHIPECSIG